MKIFMPTSNGYGWAAEASCKLLAKYWPGHPAIDLVCFEERPKAEDATVISLGRQADFTWSSQMLEYLTRHNADELLLLMLDDYGLFQAPRLEVIEAGRANLLARPCATSFA